MTAWYGCWRPYQKWRCQYLDGRIRCSSRDIATCQWKTKTTASQVYRQQFWMWHWQHFSPKRSKVWSVSYAISALDRGPLVGYTPKEEDDQKTTIRYVDGHGKVRFKGSPALKSSQLIGCNKQLWYCDTSCSISYSGGFWIALMHQDLHPGLCWSHGEAPPVMVPSHQASERAPGFRCILVGLVQSNQKCMCGYPPNASR